MPNAAAGVAHGQHSRAHRLSSFVKPQHVNRARIHPFGRRVSVVTHTRFLYVQESIWQPGPAMHPRRVSDVERGWMIIFCILLRPLVRRRLRAIVQWRIHRRGSRL